MNTRPQTPLTDDELGSRLGESLRERVDATPTARPPFGRVEQRARQISRRRRAGAGLAVGAAAVFGGLGIAAVLSGDEGAVQTDVVTEPPPSNPEPADTEPTPPEVTPEEEEEAATDDDPAPDGFVSGLDDLWIAAIVDDGARLIGVTEEQEEIDLLQLEGGRSITDAVVLADGTYLTREGPTTVDDTYAVVHLAADAVTLSENGVLLGGAVIDDVPYAFVADTPGEGRPAAPLLAVDLRTYDAEVILENANGDESIIANVDVAGDLLLIEVRSEGGAAWVFRRLDGSDAGFSPVQASEGPGDVWPINPHFDPFTEGLVWLELDPETGRWSFITGTFAGEETGRYPLDLPADAAQWVFQLEVTEGLLVANRIEGERIEPGQFDPTTVWIVPTTADDGDATAAFEFSAEIEDGIIVFVEPRTSTQPSEDVGDAD